MIPLDKVWAVTHRAYRHSSQQRLRFAWYSQDWGHSVQGLLACKRRRYPTQRWDCKTPANIEFEWPNHWHRHNAQGLHLNNRFDPSRVDRFQSNKLSDSLVRAYRHNVQHQRLHMKSDPSVTGMFHWHRALQKSHQSYWHNVPETHQHNWLVWYWVDKFQPSIRLRLDFHCHLHSDRLEPLHKSISQSILHRMLWFEQDYPGIHLQELRFHPRLHQDLEIHLYLSYLFWKKQSQL